MDGVATTSFILFFLHFDSTLAQKSLTAELGQTVTLPCRAPDNSLVKVVDWSRADSESEYVLLYRDEKIDPENQQPSFRNRVDLQDRPIKNGDVSLILQNVTTDDRGTYECRVFQGKPTRGKRAVLKTDPISIINLDVVPQALKADQRQNRRRDGLIGLAVLPAVVAVVAAVIWKKNKNKKANDSAEEHQMEEHR
ncbi:myelin-oligodendrocyte glycoprotein-like isoform 1-T1 [Anableps anableps]